MIKWDFRRSVSRRSDLVSFIWIVWINQDIKHWCLTSYFPLKSFKVEKKSFGDFLKLIFNDTFVNIFAAVEFLLTIVNRRIEWNDCIFQKEICSYFRKLLSTQKSIFGLKYEVKALSCLRTFSTWNIIFLSKHFLLLKYDLLLQ